MSGGRAAVFAALRVAGVGDANAVAARFSAPPRGPLPARAAIAGEEAVAEFIRRAELAAATVERIADWSGLPQRAAERVAAGNLPARLRIAPDDRLTDLPWTDTSLDASAGAARPDDAAALSVAAAGVAETGTLMLLSGPAGPSTLNFLPDLHIVALDAAAIAGALEDALARLRAGGAPRTVNFVTGPSRSADIEQTLLMGAHGPRALHVVVVG